MIQGSTLTYANRPNAFLTWRPENSNINTLLVSVVTTIIVAQLFTFIQNLLLRSRQRNNISISDLYIQLVAWRSSARQVIHAITPSKGSHVAAPRPSQVLKLLSLVLAAPIINSVFVAFSLEQEKTYTFESAGFGGIALGIRLNNTKLTFRPFSSGCKQVPLEAPFGSDETPQVKFVLCEARSDLGKTRTDDLIQVEVWESTRLQGFDAVVSSWTGSIHARKAAEIRLVNASRTASAFFLHQLASEREIRDWAMSGLRVIRSQCGLEFEAFELVELLTSIEQHGAKNYMVFGARCGLKKREEIDLLVRDILNEMMSKISFVNTANASVIEVQGVLQLEQGTGDILVTTGARSLNDFPLFTRRAPILGVGGLLVIMMVVVLLRVASSVWVSNDIPIALGAILRHGLGLPCADSMLPVEGIRVHY